MCRKKQVAIALLTILLTPQVQAVGWTDKLSRYNTVLWTKANGWTSNPFNVGWRADHVKFAKGIMTLKLDNQPCLSNLNACSGRAYASGHYRTIGFYGYGKISGRIKPAKGNGIVSSLFTYTGPSDGQPWDEIDIEFLGKNTTQVQLNYYTNGVGGHETLINLGFDAATAYHTYGFSWSSSAITWYVDGVAVHTETGARGPLPTHPGRIMANLWTGIGVDSWLNPFVYPGTPLNAYYDSISYTAW